MNSPFQAAVSAGLIPESELPKTVEQIRIATVAQSSAPVSTVLPAKADTTAPVTHDDLLAAPASAATSYLTNSISLEGGTNSPAVTSGANDPGLNSNSVTLGGVTMSKTWMWVIAIVVALLALWYFYGSSTATA